MALPIKAKSKPKPKEADVCECKSCKHIIDLTKANTFNGKLICPFCLQSQDYPK